MMSSRRTWLLLALALAAGLLSGFRGADAFMLKAGAAKTVITPPDPEKPRVLVYGARSRGLVHDIHARALSLYEGNKRIVIVTYDLNCLDVATPILRKRCRDELGIGPDALILLATHNHAAPIQIVPENFPYGRWLAERIFALIKEAVQNESGPARLFFGRGKVNFIANMWFSPADREVQVLKVTVKDKPLAVLFNHPSHPLQETTKKIGVGHPGYAMEELEKAMPGVLAMYADACGGDQIVLRGWGIGAPDYRVKAVGRTLAREVMRVLSGPMEEVTGPLASSFQVIPLPLAPPMSYEEALKLVKKKHIPADIGFVPYPHPDRETNWVRNLLMHYEKNIPFPEVTTDRVCTDDGFLVLELPEPRDFPCRYEETIVARLGRLVFVAMQGEVCAGIGLRLKDAYADKVPLMVFAYMGEHNLYIPTRKLVRMNVYQAKVIQIQYASPVGWAESVEDEMVKAVSGMIEKMMD